jgi:hypothetical protein
VSHRKREVALEASPAQLREACKRVAAAAGWRSVRQSPRLLYFREPFSLGRLRQFRSRLELTVRLEPHGTKTRVLAEGERVGALQSLYVELDLERLLDRLSSAVATEGHAATEPGGRSLADPRRGPRRAIATRVRKLRLWQLLLLGLGLALVILAVGARIGGAADAAKTLVLAGVWIGWVPPRGLELLRLRAIGAGVRRDLAGFWLPLLVGALFTWFVLTR